MTSADFQTDRLARFVRESLEIEGISRPPLDEELTAHEEFLVSSCDHQAVVRFQAVITPGKPLRDQKGMDVSVGRHDCPPGGMSMLGDLASVLKKTDPFECHVAFELLHPFLDGNGRTGRAIWAWKMITEGQDPFAIPFLHRFYYQALDHASRKPASLQA